MFSRILSNLYNILVWWMSYGVAGVKIQSPFYQKQNVSPVKFTPVGFFRKPRKMKTANPQIRSPPPVPPVEKISSDPPVPPVEKNWIEKVKDGEGSWGWGLHLVLYVLVALLPLFIFMFGTPKERFEFSRDVLKAAVPRIITTYSQM